ncbi:MAG: acyltransferase [Crocinitomicaceae bacterium]|nr:acyltransferase [Crocinitomicaceae bacterium]
MRNFLRKLCYRIYINGKNYYNNNVEDRLDGVSKVSNRKNLELGNKVSFGGEVMLMGNGKIKIGNNTMIGAGSIVHSSTHDYERVIMNEVRIDKDVLIGNNVWVGTGVIINPGIEIGDNSVIGSGSVVTKNVKPYDIVAGVPAKVLKSREELIKK